MSSKKNVRKGDMKFPTVRVALLTRKSSRKRKAAEMQQFEVILDENASATPKDPSFLGVGKCVSVTAKKSKLDTATRAFDKIKITFEFNTLTLCAYGECCSTSWFEILEGDSWKSLEGAEIIDFQRGIEDIEMPDSNIIGYHQNKVNVFIVRNPDGTTRPFVLILRNSSNGYYDGYISAEWEYKAHNSTPIPKSAHLTVVVGLPGCGKTTYVHEKYDTSKVKFYDDYLGLLSFSNGREIMNALMRGEHVIIADPRLCDPKVFEREIIETFISDSTEERRANLLNAKKQLTIVYFSNNPCQCVKNVIKREIYDKANNDNDSDSVANDSDNDSVTSDNDNDNDSDSVANVSDNDSAANDSDNDSVTSDNDNDSASDNDNDSDNDSVTSDSDNDSASDNDNVSDNDSVTSDNDNVSASDNENDPAGDQKFLRDFMRQDSAMGFIKSIGNLYEPYREFIIDVSRHAVILECKLIEVKTYVG